MYKIPGAAAIHQQYPLARQSFAIERRALLPRMISVVADGDVLSEELLAHAFVQAGALVFERGGGEIVKKKADEVEHCCGFEDGRVTSRGKLARVDGKMCLLAGSRSEFLWIKGTDVCRVGFGPAGSRVFLGGDGKLGVRFAIRGKKAARIAQSGLALAVRIDSGGDLALLDRRVTGAPDRAGSLFSGESGRLFDETVYTTIPLPSGHWQEARGLRLAVRKKDRGFDRGPKPVFIHSINRNSPP